VKLQRKNWPLPIEYSAKIYRGTRDIDRVVNSFSEFRRMGISQNIYFTDICDKETSNTNLKVFKLFNVTIPYRLSLF